MKRIAALCLSVIIAVVTCGLFGRWAGESCKLRQHPQTASSEQKTQNRRKLIRCNHPSSQQPTKKQPEENTDRLFFTD